MCSGLGLSSPWRSSYFYYSDTSAHRSENYSFGLTHPLDTQGPVPGTAGRLAILANTEIAGKSVHCKQVSDDLCPPVWPGGSEVARPSPDSTSLGVRQGGHSPRAHPVLQGSLQSSPWHPHHGGLVVSPESSTGSPHCSGVYDLLGFLTHTKNFTASLPGGKVKKPHKHGSNESSR